jgi:hypothetical protein
MSRAALILLLLGCETVSVDDAGVDGGRDAPRTDAGFSPDALAPCVLDDGAGFDAADYAAYDFGEVSPAARRLFYPLTLIEAHGAAGAASALADRRARAHAAAACAGEPGCIRAQLAFDEATALSVGDEAVALVVDGAAFDAELRTSGACERDVDAAACIARTLVELSAGMGFLGEIPAADLADLVGVIATEADTETSFAFGITALVERGLVLADRLEPLRYEPLEDENAAAITAMASTDWDAFAFTAIVVPGQGPTDDTTALNPAGRARADLGYERWAAHLAPFIIFSGGHVHPDRTAYSEAIEMRRYLIEERDVPAAAILIDPYARHTTTNLRNITRVLARSGVPMDRPILITTDIFQSTYIGSDGFIARCDEELGYPPFEQMVRLSTQDLCFAASRTSLTIAPSDPLDP